MASQPTVNAELQKAIEAAKKSFSRLPNGDDTFEKCKTGQISIIDVAKDARGSFANKKSTKRLERLQKHTAWLQGLSGVIETVVQTKADCACPIWAPIKFVLKVSDDHSRATDQILLMLDTITQGMGHAGLYDDLESDADIDAALLALFKDVVDYCIQVAAYFGRSTFKRLASMVAKPYKHEFSEMRNRIRDHTTHLHRLVMEKEAIRAAQSRDEERRIRCRKWLRPCTLDEIHQRQLATRIPGTCEWIQSNSVFLDWKTAQHVSSSERILRISGVHGCGKSVLASALVESLKSEGHRVIFFSFSTTDGERQTANSVARFLLSHFLNQAPREAVDAVHTLLSHEQHPSTVRLWELLQGLLRQESQPILYIFDGLDEASDDRQEVVNGMFKVLGQRPKSKCLFLGRPQAFDNIPESVIPRTREITMDQTLTKPDIDVFIDARINELDTLRHENLRGHASETLKKNCGSMFLWANLMVKDLSHAYTKHDTMEKLGNLPNDLEAAYRQILVRLKARLHQNEQLLLRNVLTFVVTARRTLSPLELSWAHALQVSSNSNSEAPVQDFLLDRPEKRILHVCRDFVSIYGGRVHLNHSSIKDFLTRNQVGEQPSPETGLEQFYIDLPSANALFADLCIDYLDMENHGYPIREPETLDELRKLHPFVEYASYNFFSHIRSSQAGLSKMVKKLKSLFASTRVISCIDHMTIAWSEADFDASSFLSGSGLSGGVDWEIAGELFEPLSGQVNQELDFRSREYGAEDARTEHLSLLKTVLNFAKVNRMNLNQCTSSTRVDWEPIDWEICSPPSHPQESIAAAQAVRVLQNAQVINSQRQVSVFLGIISQLRRRALDPLHLLYKLFLDKAKSLPVYAVLGIGLFYFELDKNEQALELSLKILPRVEGRDTLEESLTRSLIGSSLCCLGRYEEAIAHLVLGSKRREFNPRMARSNLGKAFWSTHRYEEGVSTMRSIMITDKRRYGKSGECVVESEYQIGLLLSWQEQDEESLACFRRALEMLAHNQDRLPKMTRRLIEKKILVYIGAQLFHLGRHNDAVSWFQEHHVDPPEESPEWLQAAAHYFFGLSLWYANREHENFSGGLDHLEKSYWKTRNTSGEHHEKTLIRLSHFVRALEEAEKFEDMLRYAQILHEAHQTLLGDNHPDTEEALEYVNLALDFLSTSRELVEDLED